MASPLKTLPGVRPRDFDFYEHDLRQELSGDSDSVKTLWSKLVWVDDKDKTLGIFTLSALDAD